MAKRSTGRTKQSMKETDNDDDDGSSINEEEEEDVDGKEPKQQIVVDTKEEEEDDNDKGKEWNQHAVDAEEEELWSWYNYYSYVN